MSTQATDFAAGMKLNPESDVLTAQNVPFMHDQIVSAIYARAEEVTKNVASATATQPGWDHKIDSLVTSRIFGYPLMLALLGTVFWLTISGANYPSAMLADFFFAVEQQLTALFMLAGAPAWLHGIAVLGTYRGLAWVISVMLPPMAIFFPLFTILEDLGYLPRVAFNLDHVFKRFGAHGKQALTMTMGFGCNAAGVIAARIIDSPRERMLAILTNSFVPCNGRFPTLIAIAMIFMGAGALGSLAASATVAGLVLVGVAVTLLVSLLLTKTLLRGTPSAFTLELPPYRRPKLTDVIVRSFFDRTLFVLRRAVIVAAPAGALTWLLANVRLGDISVLAHISGWLDPFGRALGLDGIIILSFILGLPANEIVVPIMVMSYMAAGAMTEAESLTALQSLLVGHGWTWVTALNFMLFSLLHFPCGTTLLTIRKETGSLGWAVFAALMPLAIASLVCLLVAQAARLAGLL